MTEPEKFKLSTILYGIVVPIIVGIIIIALPTTLGPGARHIFGEGSPIPIIITIGFAQMLILGVPLLLGLIWNKWAGGAAGFLMGTMWYLANAGMYTLDYFSYGITQWNFFREASFIGYIVNAILIGYIGGALNGKSFSFKRMLGASLTASIITAVFQFILNYQFSMEPLRAMVTPDPLYAFFLVIVPQIALAVIVPIIAKVFTWYGIMPGGYT